VSSSPATRSNIHRPQPAGRLIPGAPSFQNTAVRKKPASVTQEGKYWVPEELANTLHRPQPKALQLLTQAVLPRPAARAQHGHLAAWVLTDFCCVALASALIGYLPLATTAVNPFAFAPGTFGFLFLQGTMLTLLAYSEGLYRSDLMWSAPEQRIILGKVVALSTLLIAVATYISGSGIIPLITLAAGAPLNYTLMSGCRAWHRLTTAHARHRRIKNVLIVGTGRVASELASYMDGSARAGRLFRGFIVEDAAVAGDIRGTLDDLPQIARAEFIDEIILTDTRDAMLARRAIREAQRNRLDIKIVPDLFGFMPEELSVEDLSGVPTLTLHEESFPVIALLLKRMLDVVGSATALLLCAPLLASIALLIRLDSAGPILYRASRIGRKGVRFSCFKFRTMVPQADALKDDLRSNNQRKGPFFKIANDPRITRVGRFLRRYSLDELPQLWNVLLGDMSLVGPRPHPLDDCAHYVLDHLRRLDVTPGITGLWQVTARRDPSFERNMALDLEYIEKWSLAMDLRILLKTLSVVLKGTGA
jgi:exopolysaccharide biosynthesis polyprenyl glycosylphosphotransferase